MRQLRCNRGRAARRQGLTILEVLMAIGVAIIGLFGVWALIPLAGQRAQQAILEDDKSAFGRSAFHDFDVRGMRDPNNWLWQSNPGQPNRFVTVPSQTVGNSLGTPLPAPGISFCIDPLLIAEKRQASPAAAVQFFPFVGPPAPVMPRVTLLSQLNVPPTHPLYAMNRPLAQRVFQTNDDLLTSRQDDETRPALQEYSKADPDDPTSTPFHRLADGSLSWLATVVPAHGFNTDAYLLSIAVFNKRNLVAGLNEQEAVFDISAFPGGGFGGGDIQIASGVTELKRDDWVVLAQTGFSSRFGWYRIVSVDEENNVTHATLEGRDWDVSLASKVIAVRNVVAVYEKTIRLEISSGWKTN